MTSICKPSPGKCTVYHSTLSTQAEDHMPWT